MEASESLRATITEYGIEASRKIFSSQGNPESLTLTEAELAMIIKLAIAALIKTQR